MRKEVIIKREFWARYGYVNVARKKGKILSWEKWNRKEKKYAKTFTQRKSKDVPTLNPNVQSYSRFKKVNQVIAKRPLDSEVGQIQATIEARKGRRYVRVKGYSYLNDPSRSKKMFNLMLKDAKNHAFAKLPFSPDSMRVIDIKFIYYTKR